MNQHLVTDLKAAIRSIPDYPKPGIVFRDITTLLGDARAFRRAVSDAALGAIKPQLVYKATRNSGTLTVADRWFPSSQIHHH